MQYYVYRVRLGTTMPSYVPSGFTVLRNSAARPHDRYMPSILRTLTASLHAISAYFFASSILFNRLAATAK